MDDYTQPPETSNHPGVPPASSATEAPIPGRSQPPSAPTYPAPTFQDQTPFLIQSNTGQPAVAAPYQGFTAVTVSVQPPVGQQAFPPQGLNTGGPYQLAYAPPQAIQINVYGEPSPPENYLILSVAVCLCCNWCLGVIPITYSCK